MLIKAVYDFLYMSCLITERHLVLVSNPSGNAETRYNWRKFTEAWRRCGVKPKQQVRPHFSNGHVETDKITSVGSFANALRRERALLVEAGS